MNKHGFRKPLIAIGTAAALLLSAVPALAQQIATPPSDQLEAQHEQERNHWGGDHHFGKNGEEHKARKLKHLQEAAGYFGISTEGKSAEQLIKELKAARDADPAKWEKFKAEMKAKRLAKLQEKAAALGIKTEGKSAKQLREEICKKHGQDKPNTDVTPLPGAKAKS
ncbi:hypothetical protein [Paenibacillus montanisoli]|uniref:Uncharacterized protein n=1 Tax=Paenibacillus montanisoli TaxID=2081970 RepID=A0A328TXH1_9BACL|nr:hypothetical protein [Paenibacillus montanisoli]RAP73801.1 hypothetical protein DL346_26470 [Paenibacillus montanisoli]